MPMASSNPVASAILKRLRTLGTGTTTSCTGLLLLSRVVGLTDPRVNEALDILESKRRPDGTWRAGGSYWKPPGRTVTGVDVVDWGRSGPNQMTTLNALRVLRAAGRL